jgi:virginiamycin B lyase
VDAAGFPDAIAAGPSGRLWFTEPGVGALGSIDPEGNVAEFPLAPGALPASVVGVGRFVWFTDLHRDIVGRVDTETMSLSEFPLPSPLCGPEALIGDGNGGVWVTEEAAGRLAHLSADGGVVELALPDIRRPDGLVVGPRGNIWVTETDGNRVSELVTANT